MKNYEVSIIVPVYNREKLIKPCIDSINSQTYDKSKWEVIFVDDASTDSSIETIELLINKSINYRVLRRPVGSGNASAPRNEGIKASSSKYVFFFDSDDYVDSQLLENGMAMALKNNSDMVYFKIAKTARVNTVRPFRNKFVDKADILEDHLMRSLRICKLYKTEMLKSNNILFDVTIDVFEDMLFNFVTLSYSKVISIVADKDYYYFTSHDGSHLSKKKITMDKRFAIYFSGLQVLYSSIKDFDNKSKFYNSWLLRCVEHFKSVSKNNLVSNKILLNLFQLASSYFNIGKEFFNVSQVYDSERILTLLFLTGDFKEFHKLANESKILESIKKSLHKEFENEDGYSKSWIFKHKTAVLDLKLSDNKIAFDIEVDENKNSLKVWMLSRNNSKLLEVFKQNSIEVKSNRYLIFDDKVDNRNEAIKQIKFYLNFLRVGLSSSIEDFLHN